MVTPGLNTILKDLIDMNRETLLSIPSIEELSEETSVQEYVNPVKLIHLILNLWTVSTYVGNVNKKKERTMNELGPENSN